MPQKPRRVALNKLDQAINHMTVAAEILINDLGAYSERFGYVKAVLDPCVIGLDQIIEGVKGIKSVI